MFENVRPALLKFASMIKIKVASMITRHFLKTFKTYCQWFQGSATPWPEFLKTLPQVASYHA